LVNCARISASALASNLAGRAAARRAVPGVEAEPLARRRTRADEPADGRVEPLAPEAPPCAEESAFVAEGFLVAFLAGLFSGPGFVAVDRAREERALAFLALPFRDEEVFAALFLTEDFLAELFFAELFLAAVFFMEVFFADVFLADDLRGDAFLPVSFLPDAFVLELWRAEVFLELVFRAALGFVAAFRFLEVLGALDLRDGFFAGLMGAGR
jgi:hypothetical protein